MYSPSSSEIGDLGTLIYVDQTHSRLIESKASKTDFSMAVVQMGLIDISKTLKINAHSTSESMEMTCSSTTPNAKVVRLVVTYK